jgi:galactoside O-acetyltransferase
MKSIIQEIRKIRYKLLSNMNIVSGSPVVRQPVLFCGKGKIVVNENVTLGYSRSPFFYSGYSHIEARTRESIIKIGSDTYINNDCVIISEGDGIEIGKKCFIGYQVSIIDSDFHGLIERSKPLKGPVIIGDDVFLGSGVKVLKGVKIGSHSTIATGAVVTKDVPENTVAAGNPAKVVKELK